MSEQTFYHFLILGKSRFPPKIVLQHQLLVSNLARLDFTKRKICCCFHGNKAVEFKLLKLETSCRQVGWQVSRQVGRVKLVSAVLRHLSKKSAEKISLFNCCNFYMIWCNSFPFFFKKMGHSRSLFLYFRLFNTVDSKHYSIKTLLMSGIEPRTSGVGSNRFAN